ncbi:MAG: hypothetical protein WC120_02975 [Parcubacteria group bacterium]
MQSEKAFELPKSLEQLKDGLKKRVEQLDGKGLQNLSQRLALSDKEEIINHISDSAKTSADVDFFENLIKLAEDDFPFELPDTESDDSDRNNERE